MQQEFCMDLRTQRIVRFLYLLSPSLAVYEEKEKNNRKKERTREIEEKDLFRKIVIKRTTLF